MKGDDVRIASSTSVRLQQCTTLAVTANSIEIVLQHFFTKSLSSNTGRVCLARSLALDSVAVCITWPRHQETCLTFHSFLYIFISPLHFAFVGEKSAIVIPTE